MENTLVTNKLVILKKEMTARKKRDPDQGTKTNNLRKDLQGNPIVEPREKRNLYREFKKRTDHY